MARRKKSERGELVVWILILGIAGSAVTFGKRMFNEHPWNMVTLLVVAAVIGIFWWWATRIVPRQIVAAQVTSTALIHRKALIKKRKQTLFYDDYGNVVYANWYKEVDYFLNRVVAPQLELRHRRVLDGRREDARRIVDKIAAYIPEVTDSPVSVDWDELTPIDYELQCAAALCNLGWNARTTKATGDQGVDVIADRPGVRVVLQCKKYNQPVGNSAVQEVFAAMAFERAQHAAVVSNASYTQAARQLAATTGVHLLHHSELSQLSDRIAK